MLILEGSQQDVQLLSINLERGSQPTYSHIQTFRRALSTYFPRKTKTTTKTTTQKMENNEDLLEIKNAVDIFLNKYEFQT